MENKSLQIMPINELKEMAQAVCKGGLFASIASPEAALTLMLICQSEGLHPIQALKRYHIIKGRPSMRSDAMLAEFQRQGGCVEWLERTDAVCKAAFSHSQGGRVEVEWTIEMARAAGLTANDTWKKYPRQMLTARVISEGVRTVLPGVVAGIYTPEEVADMIDVTPEQKKQNKPVGSVEKAAKDKIPAKPAEAKPAATESQEKTLVEKVEEAKTKPAEFEPEDASVIIEPIPEVKPADKPKKSAVEMANELKEIRALAIAAGAKNQEEIKDLVVCILGEEIESSHLMTDAQRSIVIDALKKM